MKAQTLNGYDGWGHEVSVRTCGAKTGAHRYCGAPIGADGYCDAGHRQYYCPHSHSDDLYPETHLDLHTHPSGVGPYADCPDCGGVVLPVDGV